jgi:2-methylisocitrate lyase-like PEP mutase family enzyme
MNLEDRVSNRMFTLEEATARVRAASEAANESGAPFVLNARTDIFLREIGPESERFAETARRLRAYAAAGAGCCFAPGVSDLETIRRLAGEIGAPLNVLYGPGFPSLAALRDAGVRRVSLGSGPARATHGLIRRIARELLTEGASVSLTEGAVSYEEMNRLMGE